MVDPGTICWVPSGDRGFVVSSNPHADKILVAYSSGANIPFLPITQGDLTQPEWLQIEWLSSGSVAFIPPPRKHRGSREIELYESLDGALRELPGLLSELSDLKGKLAAETMNEKALPPFTRMRWSVDTADRWSRKVRYKNGEEGSLTVYRGPHPGTWLWEVLSLSGILKMGKDKCALDALRNAENYFLTL